MEGMAVGTVLQQRNAPEAFRALDLDDDAVDRLVADAAHYVDLYTAPITSTTVSAEQLARAAYEDAPPWGRFLAWRVFLGLGLEPHPWMPPTVPRGAPDYVAGWKIVDRGDTWIRISARSWFMTAFCVFEVDDGRASFATFIRYDRWFGRLVWTPVSAVHRQLALDVLRAGVKRLERGVGNEGAKRHP